VANLPPVSLVLLIPVANLPQGVNDTGSKFVDVVNWWQVATGINDTGGKFANGVNDTGGK
jgi:hypothetical protein